MGVPEPCHHHLDVHLRVVGVPGEPGDGLSEPFRRLAVRNRRLHRLQCLLPRPVPHHSLLLHGEPRTVDRLMFPDSAPSDVVSDDDPLHTWSAPSIVWTTVNAAEALPGTVTPLTWSWYRIVAEFSTRAAFRDIGVLRHDEVCFPADPGQRIIGVFYGRNAINVSVMRAMIDRIPGQSAEAFEAQLFRTPVSGIRSSTSRRRYPAIALKAPKAAMVVHRRLRMLESEADAWWRSVVAEDGLRRSEDAATVYS